MMKNINFSELYLKWLKENIQEYKLSDKVYRITTPFLDRNNDFTEFYVIDEGNNNFKLTDDSYTFSELELSGFKYDNSNKRISIIRTILNSHGVEMNTEKELFVNCTLNDFPQKKHMLIQCMLKISDLFYLSQNNVKNIFIEDVRHYLDDIDVRYSENVSFVGKSSLVTNYDFLISKSRKAPERMIKVVNNLTYDYVKSILFSWEDIKFTRNQDTKLYTFINDQSKKPSNEVFTAFEKSDIKPILWSQKDNFKNDLIA